MCASFKSNVRDLYHGVRRCDVKNTCKVPAPSTYPVGSLSAVGSGLSRAGVPHVAPLGVVVQICHGSSRFEWNSNHTVPPRLTGHGASSRPPIVRPVLTGFCIAVGSPNTPQLTT